MTPPCKQSQMAGPTSLCLKASKTFHPPLSNHNTLTQTILREHHSFLIAFLTPCILFALSPDNRSFRRPHSRFRQSTKMRTIILVGAAALFALANADTTGSKSSLECFRRHHYRCQTHAPPSICIDNANRSQGSWPIRRTHKGVQFQY